MSNRNLKNDANEDCLQHFEVQREHNEISFALNFNLRKVSLNSAISELCSSLEKAEKFLSSDGVYETVVRISNFIEDYKQEKAVSEESAKRVAESINSGKLSLSQKTDEECHNYEIVLIGIIRSCSEAEKLIAEIDKVVSSFKEGGSVTKKREEFFRNTLAELKALVDDEWDV